MHVLELRGSADDNNRINVRAALVFDVEMNVIEEAIRAVWVPSTGKRYATSEWWQRCRFDRNRKAINRPANSITYSLC